MTARTPITLDCIIFGLQRFGGISNYWARLVDYMSVESALGGGLVLPKHVSYREFENIWSQRMPVQREFLDARISRYLHGSTVGDTGVFHTSYYRLPNKQVNRYVVSVYDFTYERYRTGLARFVHERQKWASIRRADAVLCISDSTRRDVLEFCSDVNPEKLHVTHLGVDRNTFYPDPAGSSDANGQLVLFVGQRGGYKRFDLAVEAVRHLPRLTLGIVGPALNDTERAFLRSRLGTRWHVFGPISTTDLRWLYSSVFAFIYPSDYEGFGLPILEAMACGCPVVVANRSSFPEVGGGAAYYSVSQTGESYAALLHSLDSVSEREAGIRRGIARASEFDWIKTLNKTKAVYLD